MHDGFEPQHDDLDATRTSPWLRKVEESLAKIERGIAHLRNTDSAPASGVSQVEAGASHLRSLVTKVKEIEEARSRDIKLATIDLEAVATQAIAAAKTGGGFTGLISAGKLGSLVADRSLVVMALRELVSNGIRFSNGVEEARVDITMFSSRGESIVAVRDNGIGFDPAAQQRLYVPYTTLHPRSPRAGAGLGLVLVHAVAARHGGRVWARSTPGGCTEFFMSFST